MDLGRSSLTKQKNRTKNLLAVVFLFISSWRGKIGVSNESKDFQEINLTINERKKNQRDLKYLGSASFEIFVVDAITRYCHTTVRKYFNGTIEYYFIFLIGTGREFAMIVL